jgi:hypothetical protein
MMSDEVHYWRSVEKIKKKGTRLYSRAARSNRMDMPFFWNKNYRIRKPPTAEPGVPGQTDRGRLLPKTEFNYPWQNPLRTPLTKSRRHTTLTTGHNARVDQQLAASF